MQRALSAAADDGTGIFKDVKAGFKIWLEKSGMAFGDGLFELLCLIAKYGSIARAAHSMDMSYRAAWGKIRSFEKQWGVSLVISRAGGESGGGTVLTPEAVKLVECYRCFRNDIQSAVKKSFKKCFSGLIF